MVIFILNVIWIYFMKFSFFILEMMLVSTSCVANNPIPPRELQQKLSNAPGFSGFYAGVSVGYGFGKSLKYRVKYMPKGASGGIFVGSGGVVFSNVYLGIELGYSRNNAKHYWRRTPTANLRETKISNHVEVAARVGYAAATPLLPYVKLGYVWSTVAVTNKTSGHKFFDGRVSGLLLGLGVDYKISQAVSAGIGYVSTMLNKNNNRGRFSHLKNNTFLLRVAYHL
jgi:opacity protein-like surface antigen